MSRIHSGNGSVVGYIRHLFLVCPLEIIGPWLKAGQSLDNVLQCAPEVDHLQGVVQPAGGNAEVGLMGSHMVDAVVLPRQDYVESL